MWLALYYCFTLFVYASTNGPMKLHIGVVTQDNVPPGVWRYDTMIKALAMFKDWLKAENNFIGSTKVDITWHMADGQQNTAILKKLGPALVEGTWTDDYYKNLGVTLAYDGNEPPMESCDIIMIEAWSDIFPSFLEGLKEAGYRVPVYAAGASGTGVYRDNTGCERWDNVVQGLELADKSFASILHELFLRDASSIVLFEEADGGSWVTSVTGYIRRFSQDKRLEMLVDEKISFDQCELYHGDKANSCNSNVFELLAPWLKPLLLGKRPRSYHADIFAFIGKRYMCDDIMHAIYTLSINFKAIILPNWCLSASKPILRDSPKWVKDFDYVWTPTGFSSKMKGYHFHEGYSSAAMFEKDGKDSPTMFIKQWVKKWGVDPGGYDHAWTLAAFYYLWRDIQLANADKKNIIKQFNDYRAPITSYMGLLGSKTGGWNPFNKWVGLQNFPHEDPGHLKGSRVVAPAEYAERLGTYPMPYWQDRECLPHDCDPCPKCTKILKDQWIVYLITGLPFLIIVIGLGILYKMKRFGITKSLTALAGVAVLVFKNVTNFLSIYIIFLKHEVGLVDDMSNATIQLACISLSALISVEKIRTTTYIGIYEYQQDMSETRTRKENPNAMGKIPRLQKLIVMQYIAELRSVMACLPDLVILGAQLYAILILNEVNSATMVAFLLNAFGAGGAAQSLKIADLRSEFAEYEGLPMKRNMSWSIYVASLLNPFYTEFSLMKGVLVAELRRREAYKHRGAMWDEINQIVEISAMSDIEQRLAVLRNSDKKNKIFPINNKKPDLYKDT